MVKLWYNNPVIRANIAEFKAKLSYYLRLVKGGEKVVICDRNIPVAELTSLPEQRKGKRVLGQHKGLFKVPDEAFAPLTDEELHDWFGDAF